MAFLLSIFLLLPDPASAAGWDFDLFGSAGIGKSVISSQSSGKPKTQQFLGGAALGISPFRGLSLGLLSDYRKVMQTTDADAASFGNRSGSRWNQLSPYLDLNLGKRLRLRYVHQFLGSYALDNPTSAGAKVEYGGPSGFRAEAHFCIIRGKERFYKLAGKCIVYSGLYYERMKFETEKVGQANVVDLTKPLEMTHIGGTFGFGF